MPEKIKLKKTLYIGLGGTGVATILKIKKCFIDIYGEIPPMIGFLAIDTDSSANNKTETSNRGETIKLSPNEILVCSVPNALQTFRNHPNTYDWVPSRNVQNLRNIVGDGAGQIRSNGRFIAYYNNNTIKINIQSAITRLHQNLPENSPYYVVHTKDGIDTRINVFSSVAGGTGSGMLIDVLCIIKDAVNQIGQNAYIYPWIILPEIFRSEHNGPSMANVLYNTYGALRTLDYIQHHDPQKPMINFGYANIVEPIFDYAFVINNFNQSGVSFNKLDDLLDSVAKSAFLPANKMGDEISTPFDNIRQQQDVHTYDILNKKAWAASTGSAELVYDSQAMGRAYVDKLIALLCSSMTQTQSDGTELANKFVDHADVLIRENLGRDDVIDFLLSPAPDYVLTLDEFSGENDINIYIEQNTGKEKDNQLAENLKKKLSNTETKFNEYVANILDNTSNGCVGTAKEFIRALKNIIKICRDEMIEEAANYNSKNSIPVDWNTELNVIKNTGIASIFGGKINNERKEIFLQILTEKVSDIREEKRRDWAIRFYNSFEEIVDHTGRKLDALSSYLTSIHEKFSYQLQEEQNRAESTSQFQILLHKDDIYSVSSLKLEDSIKNNFHQYFASLGGLKYWLDYSPQQIEDNLKRYVTSTETVIKACNVNIDEVLRSMPEEKVDEYIDKLKILSSPLWTYNPQGYKTEELEMDKFFIVGVYDSNTSVLATDPKYNTKFETNIIKAPFASTHQADRVYVLTVEALLPIYAINNFKAYKEDFEEKEKRSYPMASYIDEKLNNRMNSENFSLLPEIEQDNVLELWVLGFIFGHIHYDTETDQYWIRSRKRGNPIDRYRFDLGKQRNVAFDIFKSESLYKEIEELLNKEMTKNGRDGIDNKIKEIKESGNYYDDFAQLSPLEKANIKDSNFKAVLNLVSKEIDLMSE